MEGPTKGPLVYFIACANYVKVGYSDDVIDRMKSMQTGNPVELYLVMTIGYKDQKSARKGEKLWRDRLIACGKAARGEWVELEYDVIGRAVRMQQPMRAINISDVPMSTTRDLLTEALSGRCNLRARFSYESQQ